MNAWIRILSLWVFFGHLICIDMHFRETFVCNPAVIDEFG